MCKELSAPETRFGWLSLDALEFIRTPQNRSVSPVLNEGSLALYLASMLELDVEVTAKQAHLDSE